MALLLVLAIAQTQIELHCSPTKESRFVVNAIYRDYFVVDEDTAAIRYYQYELRNAIKIKQGLDCYLRIERTNIDFHPMAYDSYGMMVLSIKRELDVWNAKQKDFIITDNYRDPRYAGESFVYQQDGSGLGDEGTMVEYPQPWQEAYQFTEFVPPTFDK